MSDKAAGASAAEKEVRCSSLAVYVLIFIRLVVFVGCPPEGHRR